MENVRERSKIKIVNFNETEKLERVIARPNYRGSFVFENSELVSVSMGESKVTLNKPIYLGQAILDLSKTLMYDFHYLRVRQAKIRRPSQTPVHGHGLPLLPNPDGRTSTRASPRTYPNGSTPVTIRGHPIGGANKKVLGMMKARPEVGR